MFTLAASVPAHSYSVLASVLWQTEPSGDLHRLTIFAGIAAFSLLFVAIFLLVVSVTTLVGAQRAAKSYNELHAKIMPLLHTSQTLLHDLTPQIKNITAKVTEISGHIEKISAVAKEKTEEFAPTLSAANVTAQEANETLREANRKAAQQVARVNGMISTALDATATLGATIHHSIKVPTREVAGIVTGVKTAIDTFLGGARAFGSGSRTRTAAYRPAALRPPVIPYRSMAEESATASSHEPLTVDKRDLGL